MKKSLLILGVLAVGFANAQQYDGKVGVNTETPSATLNVKSLTGTTARTSNLILENANGERLLTVMDSKSVGIGVENPSADELNINNRIRFSYNTRAWGVGIAAHTSAWARGYNFTSIDGATKFGGFAGYGGNNNLIYFFIGDDYRNPIVNFIPSSNRVGIGLSVTDVVTEKLDVNGNARLRALPNVAGANTDKVVVVDNTGVLKTVDRSALGGSATQVGTGEDNMPCSEPNRGKMNFKKAEDGKSDVFGICLKNANGSYNWAYFIGGGNPTNGSGAFGSGL